MKMKISIAIAAVLSVLLAFGACLAFSPVSRAADRSLSVSWSLLENTGFNVGSGGVSFENNVLVFGSSYDWFIDEQFIKQGDEVVLEETTDGECWSDISFDLSSLPAGSYEVELNGVTNGGAYSPRSMTYALELSETSAAAPASTISINAPTTHTEGAEMYKAIKLFDADVYDGKASNVVFSAGAESSVKDSIVNASDLDFAAVASWNAQTTAQYIADNIASGPLNGDSFGFSFASELYANVSLNAVDIVPDAVPASVSGPGYYLVVPKSYVVAGTPDAATSSPVFALVGEGNTEINPKSAIPSLKLEVKEDSTGVYGPVADATYGQSVDYRITATLPSNFDSFPMYPLEVRVNEDVYPDNSGTPTGIRVLVDGAELPASAYSVSYPTSTWTFAPIIAIADLKALDISVSASSNIVIEFSAPKSAVSMSVFDAYMTYPMDTLQADWLNGQTTMQKVNVYSYSLPTMHKVDNASGDDLAGVGFTVKNSTGIYIAAVDGVVCESAEPYTWTTAANGALNIVGVDADTYTIEEVAPLDGYKPLEGSFNAVVDASDKSAVSVSLSDAPALVSMTSDGIEVRNMKLIELPTTGQEGIALIAAAGITFLIGSLVMSLRRRKKDED